MYNTNNFKEWSKSHNSPSRLVSLMENPFKQFSASKISSAVKPMTVVEYRDMLGKLHRIPVRNRTQMREAQAYLSIFKAEERTMKQILAEYPIKWGRIEKRFLPELRREFKSKWNVSSKFVDKIAGY